MRFVFFMLAAAGLLVESPSQTIDPRDRDFWNGKFADPSTQFDRQPSHLLVDAVHGRTPGAAIDLGMGEGRNAVWLAQQGWR